MAKLRKRKRLRIALGSVAAVVVMLAAAAGGMYFWFAHQVTGFPSTSSTVTSEPGVEPPESTDILVLGCDKHPNEEEDVESRSDTVMLVHVDKEQEFLSILSLPRDLYVEIPGHGMNKLNAAYAIGGWELTEATVERLTGINVEKAVEVDFKAFSALTDALGGVYIDVDRRYYNQDADSSYENIKISPGYQLLNGADALDYVRFRHDNESDFGRMLRQQRFINAIRQQSLGWNLVFDFDDAVKALFDNILTSLSANDILRLARWGVGLSGSQIVQVSLTGDITSREIGGNKVSVVVAADEEIEEAVNKILSPPGANSGAQTTTATGSTTSGSTSGGLDEIDRSDYTTDLDAIENSGLWKKYAAVCPFQLMAPGYLPDNYRYWDKNPAEPGCYEIVDNGGKVKGHAMKMVYRLVRPGEDEDQYPQYMGIMATTWLDAPAASEGREVEYNGTTYTIVGTNQRTDHVWWVNNGVLYWVSNTLSYYLSAKELLKVAQSMLVIPTGAAD